MILARSAFAVGLYVAVDVRSAPGIDCLAPGATYRVRSGGLVNAPQGARQAAPIARLHKGFDPHPAKPRDTHGPIAAARLIPDRAMIRIALLTPPRALRRNPHFTCPCDGSWPSRRSGCSSSSRTAGPGGHGHRQGPQCALASRRARSATNMASVAFIVSHTVQPHAAGT